jgi:hypothetical protein
VVNSASIIELLAALAFLMTIFPVTLSIISHCLAYGELVVGDLLPILPAVETLLFVRVESYTTADRMTRQLESA